MFFALTRYDTAENHASLGQLLGYLSNHGAVILSVAQVKLVPVFITDYLAMTSMDPCEGQARKGRDKHVPLAHGPAHRLSGSQGSTGLCSGGHCPRPHPADCCQRCGRATPAEPGWPVGSPGRDPSKKGKAQGPTAVERVVLRNV